jgi:hypothetical protein
MVMPDSDHFTMIWITFDLSYTPVILLCEAFADNIYYICWLCIITAHIFCKPVLYTAGAPCGAPWVV